MKSRFLSLILLTVMIPAMALRVAGADNKKENSQRQYLPIQKLMNTFQVISGYYVDTVNEPHVVDEAIKAMLHTLDPHSTYSDAEATRALTEPLQGNFSGIGIQFNMLDDTVKVIQTVVGGPSEKVGILAGDRPQRMYRESRRFAAWHSRHDLFHDRARRYPHIQRKRRLYGRRQYGVYQGDSFR